MRVMMGSTSKPPDPRKVPRRARAPSVQLSVLREAEGDLEESGTELLLLFLISFF